MQLSYPDKFYMNGGVAVSKLTYIFTSQKIFPA